MAAGTKKKHSYKVGPPFRAEGPTSTICFRLSNDECAALDAHVALNETKRSDLIRDVLERAGMLTMPTTRKR